MGTNTDNDNNINPPPRASARPLILCENRSVFHIHITQVQDIHAHIHTRNTYIRRYIYIMIIIYVIYIFTILMEC